MILDDVEIDDRYVTVLGEQPTAGGGSTTVTRIEASGLIASAFGLPSRARYEEGKTQLLDAVLRASQSPIVAWEEDPAEAGPAGGRWRRVGPSAWQMLERPDTAALRRLLAPGWWHLYATDSGAPIDPGELAAVWETSPPWLRLRDQGLRLLISAHADDDPWLVWLPARD